MVNLAVTEPIKAQKFDKKKPGSRRICIAGLSLRSGYLAEANADAAPNYSYGGNGWFGDGWYWDPWFDAYTFLPGDGIFYSPFGWGFCSPWYSYRGSYFGGHFYHHFNPTLGERGLGNHYGMPANYGRGVRYAPHYGGGVFARGGSGARSGVLSRRWWRIPRRQFSRQRFSWRGWGIPWRWRGWVSQRRGRWRRSPLALDLFGNPGRVIPIRRSISMGSVVA